MSFGWILLGALCILIGWVGWIRWQQNSPTPPSAQIADTLCDEAGISYRGVVGVDPPWPSRESLRLGLTVIASAGCEHLLDCWAAGRTVDARYAADRACPPCIASRVLDGLALPTGPGRHAEE